MEKQELFEKLKEALDYNYLISEFGKKEATNIEEYIENIKYERQIEKECNEENRENFNTYKEFIHYLNEEAVGNTNYIIEAFDNNDYNKFIGYLKTTKSIVNNKIFIHFEVDNTKLTAEWQPNDNYAVWQQCGICGDDYSGYLLFPTYNHDKYFCVWYRC